MQGPHTGHGVRNYLADFGINAKAWLACSSDLNPLKHILEDV